MLVVAGLWNMTLSTVSPIMGFVGDNWSCVDHMSYSICYHLVFFICTSCCSCFHNYRFVRCGYLQNEYSHRRMSDPSSSWNYFLRGSLKRSGVRKSRSETEDVDAVGADGCAEVEASCIEDGRLFLRNQILFNFLITEMAVRV